MKRIFIVCAICALLAPALNSCREEKDIEVEALAPDADDSGDDGYDTNPTPTDPD